MHDPRILQHIDRLAQAANDFDEFVAALDELRLDRNLPGSAKRAVLKTLAQDQAIQYVAAVTGKSPRRVAES
jgi:hypothetical protein